jgi:hypothetical protein
MLVVRFSVLNGNGMKDDQDVINNAEIVKKHKRKMTTNVSWLGEGCEALELSGRVALLYTMLPPVLLTNLI